MEYLGFGVTRKSVGPLNKKLEEIMIIRPSTPKTKVSPFRGLISYYQDTWEKRTHVLQPLTRLASKSVHFKWAIVEQKPFDEVKGIVENNTLLAYPDFNNKFGIHTNASDFQLGVLIIQEFIPIAFYGRRLNGHQKRYTVTEKELMSIVETLK